MPLWYTVQLLQSVLQALAETLETLRKTHGHRLPVRVRQHEVVEQVFERLARDRHSQAAHVREIRSRQSARLMHLSEEHFARRPGSRTPAPNLPLQRS
jgi:hypothetical protein